MNEHIYTIPVNEAFDKKCGCPMCLLMNDREAQAVESILGDAMMQPDVRIKTNELGFCSCHYDQMLKSKNRLPLALILQSHLSEVRKELFDKTKPLLSGTPDAAKSAQYLDKLSEECYICGRLDEYRQHILSTIFYLWKSEKEFRDKLMSQVCFCLPHYKALSAAAPKQLGKGGAAEFMKSLATVQAKYMEELSGDVDWFTRKYDYRFKDEPWKNAKDSVERAIDLLSGSGHAEEL